MLKYLEFIILPVLGLIISMISSIAGIGGGVFMVPLFYYIGLNLKEAIGTSKLIIVFTSLISLLSYSKTRAIPVKQGIYVLIGMMPASLIGALLINKIDNIMLRVLISIFLMYYSIRLIISYKKPYNNKKIEPRSVNKPIAIKSMIIGFISGFIAGVTGTGGGAINMPFFVFLLNLQIHTAVVLSIFTIFFSALIAIVPHVLYNDINYSVAILFLGGVLIGSSIGPKIAIRLTGTKLKLVLALVLMIISIRMLFSLAVSY